MLQRRLFNTKSFDKQDPTANQKSGSKSSVVGIRPLYCTPLAEHYYFFNGTGFSILESFLIVPTVLPIKGGRVGS